MFAGNPKVASKPSQLRCCWCCEVLLELASWYEQLRASRGVFSVLLSGHVTLIWGNAISVLNDVVNPSKLLGGLVDSLVSCGMMAAKVIT